MPDDTLFAACHPLAVHPLGSQGAIRSIEASLSRSADGAWHFAYRARGDMAQIRIPARRPGERTDQLWEHTCFEAFVAPMGGTDYLEFNFSPSGQWAAYVFSDYRERTGDLALPTPPHIDVHATAGRIELVATLPAQALACCADGALIGLCAIVETHDTVDGGRSYWALRHTGERPDFHCRPSFAVALPAARPD